MKKLLYKLLKLLPNSVSLRIKMAGCVLLGDWFFPGEDKYSLNFAELSSDEVRRRLAGLPDRSIALAVNYVSKCHFFAALSNDLHLGAKSIIKRQALFLPEEQKAYDLDVALSRKIGRQYHLGSASAPGVIYHHGLATASPKLKAYVKDKIFIDAGACGGDSCYFLQQYQPAKVLSFEPSLVNRNDFVQTMKRNQITEKSYELIPMGLADKEMRMGFSANGKGGDLELSNELTGEVIDVVTLDGFLSARDCTVGFIKADLEGMGLAFVQGAIQTITRNLPVLSLSIYHNQQELFGIYELLKSHGLNYKYQIQTFHRPCYELSLFAVPEKVTD